MEDMDAKWGWRRGRRRADIKERKEVNMNIGREKRREGNTEGLEGAK